MCFRCCCDIRDMAPDMARQFGMGRYSPALAVLATLAPWAIGWASDIPVLVAMTRAVRAAYCSEMPKLEHARNVEVL